MSAATPPSDPAPPSDGVNSSESERMSAAVSSQSVRSKASSTTNEDSESRRKAISNSLRQSHDLLVVQHDKEACLDLAFDEMDVKKNGVLDRSELYMFMEEAAKYVRLQVEEDVVHDAVDALLQDAHQGKDLQDSVITREQFYEMFQRHPDLLRAFDDEESMSALKDSGISWQLSEEEQIQDEKEKEEVWAHARTHWRNKYSAIAWALLYFIGNTVAFTYKAILYHRNEEAQAVFGECITVARGAAQALNLNACLILLPICHHFLTWLRGMPLVPLLFPFDASLEVHIGIGIVIALFSTAHCCAHACDFYRFARADEADIYRLFGDKLGPIPDGIGARWGLLLKQPAAITGIIMVLCLIIAYVAIYWRRKAFNCFWYSHHLLIIFLIALCFHGMGSLLEPFQSVYWVIGPLIIYAVPRFLRETKCSNTQVLSASVMDGEIVSFKLAKPSGKRTPWNKVEAGMYAFLNIPAISCTEWHPFTLTSAPYEDHLEFAVAAVGDWTKSARDVLGDGALEADYPKIKVQGPIGASSQGFSKYPVLVLVGAGIGVTPMISVVKQLLKNPGQMKRTILYWTVRDRAAFDWFASVLDQIYDQDDKHVIQIRHFLTSVKHDDRDLGAVLLHHAVRARHHHTDIDLLLGRQTHHQVEVGRPIWDEELCSVRADAKELGFNECGIFLCGPTKMAEELDKVSFSLSKEDPKFHFYFHKETF